MGETIGKAVAQHLNFARSVVRPVISELVQAIQADIQALPVNVEMSLQLVVCDPPLPMLSPEFEDMIGGFGSVNYMPLDSYLSLAPLSATEILENMATGIKALDADVAQWASGKGDTFLTNVWESVFTAEPTQGRFSSLVQDRSQNLDAAIVVFLLTRRLHNNPPEGTKMGLVPYNDLIAQMRNQAALRLHHGYEDYARNSRNKRLIERFDSTSVSVNGNVYRQWIEDGGKDAVIFGSLLSPRPAVYVPEINEGKTAFITGWEKHNLLLTTAERNKRGVRYREILKGRLMGVVGANLQECFAHLRPGIPADTSMPEWQQFVKNADTFVNAVNDSDFNNLWMLCMHAVCRCAFYYTAAEAILGGVERAVEANPDIEVREAALLATAEYVVDYICDQIAVVSS